MDLHAVKIRRLVVVQLIVLITLVALCPRRLIYSRVWGGHCFQAIWNIGQPNLRVAMMTNRYYTGIGIYLPAPSRNPWCDYAIAFNGDSLYVQYPLGRSAGIKTLIDFKRI